MWRIVILVMIGLLAADQAFVDGRFFDALLALARQALHHFRI
jgi:hypothetical protein